MSQVRKLQNGSNGNKLGLPINQQTIDPTKKRMLKFVVNGQDMEVEEDEVRSFFPKAFEEYKQNGWASDKHSQSWNNTLEKIIANGRDGGTYTFNTDGSGANSISFKDKDPNDQYGGNSTLGLNDDGKVKGFGIRLGTITNEAKQARIINNSLGKFIAERYKNTKTQDQLDNEWLEKTKLGKDFGGWQGEYQGKDGKTFLEHYWEGDDKHGGEREKYIRQYIEGNSKDFLELMKPENEKYRNLYANKYGVNFNAMKAIYDKLADSNYKFTRDDLRSYSEALGMGNTNHPYYHREINKAQVATENQQKADLLKQKEIEEQAAIDKKNAEASANIYNNEDLQAYFGARNGHLAIVPRNGSLVDPMFMANGRELPYEAWIKHANQTENGAAYSKQIQENYRKYLNNSTKGYEDEGYVTNFNDSDFSGQKDHVAYRYQISNDKRPFEWLRNDTSTYAGSPIFKSPGYSNAKIYSGMEKFGDYGLLRRKVYINNDYGDIISGRINNGVFVSDDNKVKLRLGNANEAKRNKDDNSNFNGNARYQLTYNGKQYTRSQFANLVRSGKIKMKDPMGPNWNSMFGRPEQQYKGVSGHGLFGSGVTYYRQGGKTEYGGTKHSTNATSTLSRAFSSNASAEEKLRLAALTADVGSLVGSFVPGANWGAAGVGAAGTTMSLIADWKKDGLDWSDAGRALMGYGADALTLVPLAGGMAKLAKTYKAVKYTAPLLKGAFIANGLKDAAMVAIKAGRGEDLSIDDWKVLSNGLLALHGGVKSAAVKRAAKPGVVTKPKVAADVEIKKVGADGKPIVETKRFNVGLNKGQAAQIADIKMGPKQVTAANNVVEGIAKGKITDGEVGNVNVVTKTSPRIRHLFTKKANREYVPMEKESISSLDYKTPSEGKNWYDRNMIRYANWLGAKPKGSAHVASGKLQNSSDKANDAIKEFLSKFDSSKELPALPMGRRAAAEMRMNGSNVPEQVVSRKRVFIGSSTPKLFRKGGRVVKMQGGSTGAGFANGPGQSISGMFGNMGKWLNNNVSGSDVMNIAGMLHTMNTNKQYDTRVERPIMQQAPEAVKSVVGNGMITNAYQQGATRTMQSAKNLTSADGTANRLTMLAANDSANRMMIEGNMKNAEYIDQSREQAEQYANQAAGMRSQIANKNIETFNQADQAERAANNMKMIEVAKPVSQFLQNKGAQMKLDEVRNDALRSRSNAFDAQYRVSTHPEYIKDQNAFNKLAEEKARLALEKKSLDSKQQAEYDDLNKRLTGISYYLRRYATEAEMNPRLGFNDFLKNNAYKYYNFSNVNGYGSGGKLSSEEKIAIEEAKINSKAISDYIKNYLTLNKEARARQEKSADNNLKAVNDLIKKALDI